MSIECINEDGHLSSYSPRTSDLWALGIVLVSLLTGRIPWVQARSSVAHYAEYLRSPETFFRTYFPVSKAVNDLLLRLLDIDPRNRPTLDWVKETLLKIDTFYMTPSELDDASVHARQIATEYFLLRSVPPSSVIQSELEMDQACDIADMLPTLRLSDEERVPTLCSSGSESSDETSGPTTPEAAPVDVEVDITDCSLLDEDVRKRRKCGSILCL